MAPAVATWVSRMTGRHGRVLTIEFERCFIVNVNCPDCANVIEREAWDLALIDFVQALDRRKPVIIAGDFKAAHSSMDVRPPKKPSYRHHLAVLAIPNYAVTDQIRRVQARGAILDRSPLADGLYGRAPRNAPERVGLVHVL